MHRRKDLYSYRIQDNLDYALTQRENYGCAADDHPFPRKGSKLSSTRDSRAVEKGNQGIVDRPTGGTGFGNKPPPGRRRNRAKKDPGEDVPPNTLASVRQESEIPMALKSSKAGETCAGIVGRVTQVSTSSVGGTDDERLLPQEDHGTDSSLG